MRGLKMYLEVSANTDDDQKPAGVIYVLGLTGIPIHEGPGLAAKRNGGEQVEG